jgi:hypothetical protein
MFNLSLSLYHSNMILFHHAELVFFISRASPEFLCYHENEFPGPKRREV